MAKSNTTVVREFIEEVFNRKQYESFFEFCDKGCIMHVAPYVGTGINYDASSDEKAVVVLVAPHGPAHGHLEVGDVILGVRDDVHRWETFEQVKTGLWGQGIPGVTVTFTVNRGGKTLTVPVTRARIDGLEIKLADFVEMWGTNMRKYWPDFHQTIEMLFGDQDLVTCYAMNSGTHQEYHREAIWSETYVYRLKKGKITDMWGVTDDLAQIKQLGYQIHEPMKVSAR